MAGDDVEGRELIGERPPTQPHDVGHDGGGGSGAIGADIVGEAADHGQEPVDLALGVVEAACAGPTVGAAEDSLVALLRSNALQLGCHQIEGRVPGHLDVWISASALGVGSGPSSSHELRIEGRATRLRPTASNDCPRADGSGSLAKG